MCSLNIVSEADCTTCLVDGELDAFTVPTLRSGLRSMQGCGPVVIDLSGVAFVDSSGLGALVGGVRRIREAGGDVVLCSPTRTVARVLHTTGIDRLVAIVGSAEEARDLHRRPLVATG